jgi:predicted neutral ceramidase superfamily lipid hydrolase
MEMTRNVLLLTHLAGMAGILISLLRSRTKITMGLTHSALTALVAGLALVAIRYPLHNEDPIKWPLIDNAKIGMKLTFVFIILILAFTNKKKESVSSTVWSWIAALTIGNIIIAVVW